MMHIDFPLHFDGRGRTARTDDEDHIRDLIEQLLLTNPGERVNRPDLGSGLLAMVFEPLGPEVKKALEHAGQAALQHWLGDLIEVHSLEASSHDSSLRVEVVYTLLRNGEQRTKVFEQGGQT